MSSEATPLDHYQEHEAVIERAKAEWAHEAIQPWYHQPDTLDVTPETGLRAVRFIEAPGEDPLLDW